MTIFNSFWMLRESNPDIKAFMAANGLGQDLNKVEQYYFDRLTAVTQEVTQNQMRYIVWQERKLEKLCLNS